MADRTLAVPLTSATTSERSAHADDRVGKGERCKIRATKKRNHRPLIAVYTNANELQFLVFLQKYVAYLCDSVRQGDLHMIETLKSKVVQCSICTIDNLPFPTFRKKLVPTSVTVSGRATVVR